jgi:hypothetical protein
MLNVQAGLKYDDVPTQTRKSKPRKYIFTPVQDEMIRRLYREKYDPREGRVKALAESFHMPRYAVSHRALELGVTEHRIKEPKWSAPELHILELNALRTPKTIQKRLKLSGFNRGINGIMLKRKRMRYREQQDKCSCRAIAKLFGVDSSTVADHWIRKGFLKAERKGTTRTPQQGGDEWFIKEKDVRQFIVENIGIIDIRKVDKFWLVDILAGGSCLGD